MVYDAPDTKNSVVSEKRTRSAIDYFCCFFPRQKSTDDAQSVYTKDTGKSSVETNDTKRAVSSKIFPERSKGRASDYVFVPGEGTVNKVETNSEQKVDSTYSSKLQK